MRMQCVLFVVGAIEMTINDADDDDRCNFFYILQLFLQHWLLKNRTVNTYIR